MLKERIRDAEEMSRLRQEQQETVGEIERLRVETARARAGCEEIEKLRVEAAKAQNEKDALVRFSAERQDAEQSHTLEERLRNADEIQRLRQEQREALEEVERLRAEATKARVGNEDAFQEVERLRQEAVKAHIDRETLVRLSAERRDAESAQLRNAEEIHRLRQEQREALEEVERLRMEAARARAGSEDARQEVERLRLEAAKAHLDRETVARFSAERNEAEHTHILEDRLRTAEEVQRLRQEQREALGEVERLRVEAAKARAGSEEWRKRCEQLLAEQKAKMSALEDVSTRVSFDLSHQNTVADEASRALCSFAHERASLLYFIVDLLQAIHALFYTAPGTSGSRSTSPKRFRATRRSGSTPRAGRSSSTERKKLNRKLSLPQCLLPLEGSSDRTGGYSPVSGSSSSVGLRGSTASIAGGSAELRDVMASIEHEISFSADELAQLIHRVSEEARLAKRLVDNNTAEDPISDHGAVQRLCSAWMEQERSRRERLGLPTDSLRPIVDWGMERARYQATTQAMDAKFAQLDKLRRIMHERKQHSSHKRATSLLGV